MSTPTIDDRLFALAQGCTREADALLTDQPNEPWARSLAGWYLRCAAHLLEQNDDPHPYVQAGAPWFAALANWANHAATLIHPAHRSTHKRIQATWARLLADWCDEEGLNR